MRQGEEKSFAGKHRPAGASVLVVLGLDGVPMETIVPVAATVDATIDLVVDGVVDTAAAAVDTAVVDKGL